MRLVLASILLCAVLAGCNGPAPAGTQDAGGDAAPMPDAPRATDSQQATSLRLLDHAGNYRLHEPIAPTTLTVPGNVTDLHIELTSTASGPVGTVVGEPDDPQHPRVVLTSPDGTQSTIDANALQFRAGPLAGPPVLATLDLPSQAGEWQVTFHGRALGVDLRLVVDGTLA